MVTLRFSEPTNTPALGTAIALNNAIIINHGDIKMLDGQGIWSHDGEALSISGMDPDSLNAVTDSISAGTFHAMPRRKALVGAEFSSGQPKDVDSKTPAGQLQGNLTMRMSYPGTFFVRLYIGEKLESMSTEAVDVDLCPQQVVVGDVKTTPASHGLQIRGEEFPRPFFTVGGVLAMSGKQWLKAGDQLGKDYKLVEVARVNGNKHSRLKKNSDTTTPNTRYCVR